MRKQGLPLQRLATADALNAIAQDLHYTDLSALYAAVGEGHVSAQSVVGKLIKSAGGIAGAQEDLAETTLPDPDAPAAGRRRLRRGRRGRGRRLGPAVQVLHAGARRRDHRLRDPGQRRLGAPRRLREPASTCCSRSPSGRSACAGRRGRARSSWSAIQVEALDRTGLLSDVTRTLSDQHVNILSATVTTTRDRVAFSKFTFEMGDPKHLGHVLRAVRTIDGVYDVYRVTS